MGNIYENNSVIYPFSFERFYLHVLYFVGVHLCLVFLYQCMGKETQSHNLPSNSFRI